MANTVAGIHGGLDTHANRPAGNAVPDGSLYSCSTHSLIYKSNYAGNSWATYATLGSAASGSITSSGYTQNTARLLGRTTASSGAIEEITVGSGLSLSAGSLTATGGSGGALVFLQKQDASASATLDFASWYSATYDEYLIEMSSLVMATNTVNLIWRASTNTGSTYDSGANYSYDNFVFRSGGSATAGGAGQTAILVNYSGTSINNGTAAQASISGWMRLYSPANTSLYKLVEGMTTYFDSGGFRVANMFRGAYESTTAMDGFRFLASSGNITSGSVRVYGVAKA